ncbi:MAG: sigma-E factor negative regulatory protein [Janthinobacterium lividum]
MDMKMTHETISAFTDGEMRSGGVDEMMARLRDPDGRSTWDIYQKIGDALRSEELVANIRPGFEARLFARLETEPILLMPAASAGRPDEPAPERSQETGFATGSDADGVCGVVAVAARQSLLRRFGVPGAAAAAVAALAFISTPQLMVALTKAPATFAGMTAPGSRLASADIQLAAAPGLAKTDGAAAHHEDVLRDPGLDEYLMAHQRFSPSVYSTAQFARASTFVNETGK